MNLYIISQHINNDYDTYDSAIVCAENEGDARRMDPGGKNGEPALFGFRLSQEWVDNLADVHVRLIGIAAEDVPIGVVLASYNAS